MKNFTFKVFPTQPGLENKQEEQVSMEPTLNPGMFSPDVMEPEAAKKPCPPTSPLPPKKPCPSPEPMPVPPSMPCPPMGPTPCPPMGPMPCPPGGYGMMPCPPGGYGMTPPMPCPPGEYGGMGPCPMPPMAPGYPQYPAYSAPPFTCPYFRLAHSYVPWQYYNVVFCPAEALDRGTLFPELCMPQGEYGPCEGPRPCKVRFGGGVPYGCE